MASIVCVHGIGQQLKGEETLATEWYAPLRDGMRRAGGRPHELPEDHEITVAFYGDLFRDSAVKGDDVPYELVDIEDGIEADLVRAWLREAEAHPAGSDSAEHTLEYGKSGWCPETVQEVATALLRYPFCAALAERCFVGNLKQVSSYLKVPHIRQSVRSRLLQLFGSETRLVIAHSLGSIIAYEALCLSEGSPPPSFISLGSPLGLPNLIFDRLDPLPNNGRGVWPIGLTRWTNIADRHDFVAAVKQLAPLFGPAVRDIEVANEALAHDVRPYLTAPETGAAILEALRG